MTGSGLAELRAAAATLVAEDPSRVPPVELGARVVELRELIDGLEGLWSRLMALPSLRTVDPGRERLRGLSRED